MIRLAQYDAQCANCGGKIAAGEELDYLPPTGDRPAFTAHAGECPETEAPLKKTKGRRGQNHCQKADEVEARFIWRECSACKVEYTVPRELPAARAIGFVGQCCDGVAESPGRHLRIAA
jgi:hypothetical protein